MLLICFGNLVEIRIPKKFSVCIFILYENLDFFTLLQFFLSKTIYFSKYYHCSSFPNRGDLQIDMKKRRHNLHFT